MCVGAGVQRGVRARRGGGASRGARRGLLRRGGGRTPAVGGVGGVPLARARCAPPVERWGSPPRPPGRLGSAAAAAQWRLPTAWRQMAAGACAGRDSRAASRPVRGCTPLQPPPPPPPSQIPARRRSGMLSATRRRRPSCARVARRAPARTAVCSCLAPRRGEEESGPARRSNFSLIRSRTLLPGGSWCGVR